MKTSAGTSFRRSALLCFALALFIGGCAEVKKTEEFNHTCTASWYGPDFHGKRTSSGEIFDMNKKTAAHKTLPFGAVLRVTNIENGRSTRVVVNDRGPLSEDIEIDLSYAAAKEIGLIGKGKAKVRVEYLGVDPAYRRSDETDHSICGC